MDGIKSLNSCSFLEPILCHLQCPCTLRFAMCLDFIKWAKHYALQEESQAMWLQREYKQLRFLPGSMSPSRVPQGQCGYSLQQLKASFHPQQVGEWHPLPERWQAAGTQEACWGEEGVSSQGVGHSLTSEDMSYFCHFVGGKKTNIVVMFLTVFIFKDIHKLHRKSNTKWF